MLALSAANGYYNSCKAYPKRFLKVVNQIAKISAFEKYEKTEIRHEQVVYLNSYGLDHKTIAKITGYAVSTVKTLIRKCADLLDRAKKRFYEKSIKRV